MLQLSRSVYLDLVAHLYEGLPDEGCGLLGGRPDSDEGRAAEATLFYRSVNVAASSRVYTIDPKDHLRIEREADDRDWEINGVVHSHTHSEPYPSPTDVAAAPDPDWHYVIISLKREAPEVRSYRIVDGEITSEPIAVR